MSVNTRCAADIQVKQYGWNGHEQRGTVDAKFRIEATDRVGFIVDRGSLDLGLALGGLLRQSKQLHIYVPGRSLVPTYGHDLGHAMVGQEYSSKLLHQYHTFEKMLEGMQCKLDTNLMLRLEVMNDEMVAVPDYIHVYYYATPDEKFLRFILAQVLMEPRNNAVVACNIGGLAATAKAVEAGIEAFPAIRDFKIYTSLSDVLEIYLPKKPTD